MKCLHIQEPVLGARGLSSSRRCQPAASRCVTFRSSSLSLEPANALQQHLPAAKHHSATQRCCRLHCRSAARQEEAVLDSDLVDAVNEVSNRTLQAMLQCDQTQAQLVDSELADMRLYLLQEGDADSARFLKVLQGLLCHTVLNEADQLGGLYQQAFSRLCNQVAGSEWQLTQEGQSAEISQEEPQFSTWEDVMGSRSKRSSNGGQSGSSGAAETASNAGRGSGMASTSGVLDDTFYRVLEVSVSAGPADIKAAYRSKALQLHPDVNSAPDATERFQEISSAYDTLSDETSRRLYDRYGPQGMLRHQGATAGRGNAREAWDEFKPYKRENKRTRARDAASDAACASSDSDSGVGDADAGPRLPQMGDVVEYPLADVVKAELQDGRLKGVGLLVGRNLDRGDRGKLSEDALDLCEVEPMRQEEPGSVRWVPDELSPSTYPRLQDLAVVPVADYDKRFDVWVIDAVLSEGCGGPELPEEIML